MDAATCRWTASAVRNASISDLRNRTEEAYVHWIKRFILFHGKRHPAQICRSPTLSQSKYDSLSRWVAALAYTQPGAAKL